MGETAAIEILARSASVREIAEFVHRRGDLKSGRGGPTGQAGAAGHRALQRSRPQGYIPEVFLSETVTGSTVCLTVSGRADGIYMEQNPPIIEEIKTTVTRPLLILGDNAVHWAQAEMYGAMLAKRDCLDWVDIRLTYLDLHSNQTRSFERRKTAVELRRFFDDTVAVFSARLEKVIAWQSLRNQKLRTMLFPFSAFRPGQEVLADRVKSTIETFGRLFVEAPTGSGKTAAVLFGALSGMAAGHLSQVVYLTAKTAGRQTVEDTLLRFQVQGILLKALVLSSQKDRCLYPGGTCTPADCPLAKGHFDRLQDAVDALFCGAAMAEDDIRQIAADHRVCPYHLARETAPMADAVVCDYNYFFDPRARIAYLAEGKGARRAVLADEAHNLPDRARDMFSAALSVRQMTEVLREVGGARQAVGKAILSLSNVLSTCAQREQVLENHPKILAAPPDEFQNAMDTFLETAEAFLAREDRHASSDREDKFLMLYFETLAFDRAVRRGVQSDTLILFRHGNDLSLKLFARDPAPHLRRCLENAGAAAVFFSGTLSPLDFFSTLLGGEAGDPQLKQPPVFPTCNRLAMVASHISTRYADRHRYLHDIAQVIGAAVLEKKGNYLVFFPSHAYLAAAAQVLDLPADTVEIVVQRPQPSAAEKKKFLAKFQRKRSRRTLVGLAVMGGMFGEAVDLPGDALIGAVIVSPGLPMVRFEQELIRAHFQEKEGKGFEYAYVYPGMNKVLQAAGRVHRTPADRGILLFIGRRFTEPIYRDLLPGPEKEIRICRSADEVRQAVRSFWVTH